jgi:RHS repeat-associated protein
MSFTETAKPVAQPYKYNGKELDNMNGLNWYDYGARHYDPTIGRFTTIDRFAEKFPWQSPYVYANNNPVSFIDVNGDSIMLTDVNLWATIMAIYNGLEDKTSVHMKFNDGVLDPTSIESAAKTSNDFFLQDLYEISINPDMVEMSVSNENTYKKYGRMGRFVTEAFSKPNDVSTNEYGQEYERFLTQQGDPLGRYINGNLGQTLIPEKNSTSGKNSTNKNIQVIINGTGSLNHRTVGLAHELGHVLLYLRGLPYGHTQPGVDNFVYDKATKMSRRLGYDF